MTKEAADHHHKAAEHHENTARHHREAGNTMRPEIMRQLRIMRIPLTATHNTQLITPVKAAKLQSEHHGIKSKAANK